MLPDDSIHPCSHAAALYMPRALLDVPSPYGVEVKAALYAGGARDAAICMAWGQAITAQRILTRNRLGGGTGGCDNEPVHAPRR